MRRFLDVIVLCVAVVCSSSCNIDEDITTVSPPKIILDSETGIYTTKQGREIVIAPSYESVDGATYSWIMDGETIGTSPSLSFIEDEVGEYFLTISVATNGGTADEEIRVDVMALEVPTISVNSSRNLTVAVGAELSFVATVRETSLPTTVAWSVNSESVSEALNYTFKAVAVGNYTITATVSNDDGSHSYTISVNVLNAEDMPLVWEFDRMAYHTVVGRKLRIVPSVVGGAQDVTYAWQVDDGDIVGDASGYIFTADEAGEYHLTATATTEQGGEQIMLAYEFVVTVYESSQFYRAPGIDSKPDWHKVYEYTPAPGQFINELKTGGFDGTQTTPEAAVAYAESRMSSVDADGNPSPIWVSLGGFGGYIIVGFDHSIANSGDYDIGILGNSFDGSSEPGIVWVMQDENGNGLPDDTWYELAGSETGKEETIQDYAVTYYRPGGPGLAVQWKDNKGNSGEIDYLKTYHGQDYYYPLWIKEDSYTLTGTCLKARNYDASGKGAYWVNPHYEWGYVDNWSQIDRLSTDSNANADAKANYFKISNAVDFDCQPVNLEFVDFVKVQVGVNAKSGWLGELSTEVFGFYDYNMKK